MDSPPRVAERSSRGVRNGIQAMIMALLLVVSVGYIFIWIMTPTNRYRQKWRVKILAQTNSTYFGRQGTIILMYSFPVLFVAVLGCVYLHLGKKCSIDYNLQRTEKNFRQASWKRPIIIKGLGIVSRIELSFLVMFIALLIWAFSNYLHIGFLKFSPASPPKNGEKVWEARLGSVALYLGLVGNIGLTFLFFPVTRGSSVLQVFGLTSEASIKYHIWLGHIVMALLTAHGTFFIVYWAITNKLSQMIKWQKAHIANVPGEISLLAGLAMWATTFPRIRRKMFELFFYTHYLYIAFMLFFVLHVGISYSCTMLPGFYLFMVDRYLRFLQSRQRVRLVSARNLPCQTVELNFSKSKGLTYTPTSIIFVNVPSISKLQWHPFTISSSSYLEPENLSVIIKSEGSWSKKLYQILSSPSAVDHLDFSVEGPYGPASTDFLRHDLLVMVSGGSGITPFISIIRELIYASEKQNGRSSTPSILLISAFKNSSDLTMLDLLLPIDGSTSEVSEMGLQIEAYVTREKEPAAAEELKKSIRTVWFKLRQSDSPITPVLGQNNWLWLGAIISSSFIIFLLFMGILTRYYIYPIDKNTNEIYSYSSRAVLNILVICISIVITATAAFLWNKKQSSTEANQIQNLEGTTLARSWLHNADREMESLPQQTVSLSTNIHYGERPDLEKILSERKESSVGVLVCGPKKMRHEVAKICSSGLAANLHFKSISFSW